MTTTTTAGEVARLRADLAQTRAEMADRKRTDQLVRDELAEMTDRALMYAGMVGGLRDELEGAHDAGHDQAVTQLRNLGAVVVAHQGGDAGRCGCGWWPEEARGWAEHGAHYSAHLLGALADALTATREGSDG
jgi:hypothetical protein